MKIVKLYRSKERQLGHDVDVELWYNKSSQKVDGGALTFFGTHLLDKLSSETIKVGGQELSFDSGEDYLENLHKHYNTPYLFASLYKEQESSLPPDPNKPLTM